MVLPPGWSSVSYPQTLGAKQVHVWAWFLGSVNAGCYPQAEISLLDAGEQDRFQRFRFARDRARFAIAHANTRRILGSYLQRKPTEVHMRTNAFGKPELVPEEHTQLVYFNLSHSRNVALLALSTETEVGVDVEDIRPIEPEVANKNFSRSEVADLSSLKGDTWLMSFYRCWTRKEAIVKAEGVGLSIPLQSFDVSLLPDARPELLAVRAPTAFRHPWALHDLAVPSEGVVAALAAGNPHADVQCFWLRDGEHA